jgi:hypothetical protein
MHGNTPCESGALRTLLLHFNRPRGSSEALTAAVRLGQSLRSLGEKRTAEATASAYCRHRKHLLHQHFDALSSSASSAFANAEHGSVSISM